MTIKEALNTQDRSISSRDAEIFLQDIFSKDRAWLHAHSDTPLSAAQRKQFETYCTRREHNEPVAYIIGYREFYGRTFMTDKRALIPRPETEKLIDLALDWAVEYFSTHLKATNKPCPIRILELGTGSGNIATTLALELAKRRTPAQVIATDISTDALDLAQENWERLRKEPTNLAIGNRVLFFASDMFHEPHLQTHAPYHLIVANLPYVPDHWKMHSDAQPEVVFHEPDVALFGGEDGLGLYRRFFAEVGPYMSTDTKLLLEFGEDETEAIVRLAESAIQGRSATVHKDYANLDRILEL